ncbi:DUF262 domain-containing protein [Demequina sp. NBRC 110057]|uniref:DUF262 domain-containing protein n=1 Tax=Demequina sp. NBRC 110057 TaxID=1570346 RepID=UPI0013563E5A|nr:DUF262 domain-containing protein [Demequina sp. NBRC 110057]
MTDMGDEGRKAPAADSWMETGLVKVRDLLALGVRIPDYQRPYKWSVRNVAQLIDDIDTFRAYDRYRIGTVILHEKDDRLEIVDGQQRFITFCLIAQILGSKSDLGTLTIPTVDPDIPAVGLEVSRANIVANYSYLADALARRTDLEEWARAFLDHCEVVTLTLSHVDEAFQMFDSQNTRGKALYPTDLLKAFHIREMSHKHTTADERLAMVRMWEEIPPESIDELFSDYLFKIKQWSNNKAVPSTGFGDEHIDLFKGIREAEARNAKNNWAMPFLYAKNYTDDFGNENATLIRYGAMAPMKYPFQIDQPVINGESFFLMVRHYWELGLKCGLFREDDASKDAEIFADAKPTLDALAPAQRKATHRLVRNLFDALLLHYVDRFDDQDLDRAALLLARYAMAPRVQHQRVTRQMINNYALGLRESDDLPQENLFAELRLALRTQDFLRRPRPNPKTNGYADLHFLYETTEANA